MFAVIKTGGKQYSVTADDQLKVEKIAGAAGDIVEIKEVLMVGETVGMPFVEGAMVTAEILEQGRAQLILIFSRQRGVVIEAKLTHTLLGLGTVSIKMSLLGLIEPIELLLIKANLHCGVTILVRRLALNNLVTADIDHRHRHRTPIVHDVAGHA